jgi:hypothetical protein
LLLLLLPSCLKEDGNNPKHNTRWERSYWESLTTRSTGRTRNLPAPSFGAACAKIKSTRTWERNNTMTALMDATKNTLIETFIELDERAPAEKSVDVPNSRLAAGSKVYFANGDSRSFVAYRPSTNKHRLCTLREDKPSLADERRGSKNGWTSVYGSGVRVACVVYHDRDSGAPTVPAMSRSIGGLLASCVIPDPIVDVLISEAVAAQLDGTAKEAPEAYEIGRGEIAKDGFGWRS